MEQEWRWFGGGGINLWNVLWWMWWFTVSRRPPFLADDVILHHPCHIFGVAVGSCAACCSPVCCRRSGHTEPAPSCVCLAAFSRLSLGPLLHKGSRVVVFKRRIWFLLEHITGMVNEIQWLAPLSKCCSIQVEDAKESDEEAHKSSPNTQDVFKWVFYC